MMNGHTLRSLARTLGGDVAGRDTITCPGPGHSKRDRSLSVTFNGADESFVVHSHSGDDWDSCRDHVRRLLGLPEWRPGDEQDRRVPRAKINCFDMAALDREAAEVRQPGEDDLARIERARNIWDEAGDPRGTAVEAYLRSRALELPDDLAGRVLRFHPRTPWRNETTGNTDRIPCLIVPFSSIDDDSITAVHRIRVDQPQRWPKAERKMLGVVGASAVKLDPLRGEKLVGGEGIETCMAARQLGLRPVWAFGSSGAIARFPVLDRNIDELVILAEPGDASAQAIGICGRRYRQAGLRVRIVRPRSGDMNDTLMERTE
jgi:hypothetical protein